MTGHSRLAQMVVDTIFDRRELGLVCAKWEKNFFVLFLLKVIKHESIMGTRVELNEI